MTFLQGSKSQLLDLLAVAILAKFFLEVSAYMDVWLFVLGSGALAVLAGLGSTAFFRSAIGAAALIVWLYQETVRNPGMAWLYIVMALVLLIGYLFGRFLRWSTFAFPAAVLLALLGLGLLASVFGRP